MRFVDTNVLLYAISKDPSERRKAERANAILASRDLALSAQVLQEFYVQATRESRPDRLTHQQAVAFAESLLRFPVLEIGPSLVIAAMEARRRHRISYWDAAIIEAARALGCDSILSEDLGDGVSYDGVRVENPFVVPASTTE